MSSVLFVQEPITCHIAINCKLTSTVLPVVQSVLLITDIDITNLVRGVGGVGVVEFSYLGNFVKFPGDFRLGPGSRN